MSAAVGNQVRRSEARAGGEVAYGLDLAAEGDDRHLDPRGGQLVGEPEQADDYRSRLKLVEKAARQERPPE